MLRALSKPVLSDLLLLFSVNPGRRTLLDYLTVLYAHFSVAIFWINYVLSSVTLHRVTAVSTREFITCPQYSGAYIATQQDISPVT
jgi:hypothetical protein